MLEFSFIKIYLWILASVREIDLLHNNLENYGFMIAYLINESSNAKGIIIVTTQGPYVK